MEILLLLAIAALAFYLVHRLGKKPRSGANARTAPIAVRPSTPHASRAITGTPFRLWGSEGWPNIEVVGEAYHRGAFAALYAQRRARPNEEFFTSAALVPEFDNPYDTHAVAVHVDGHQVGHLAREDAAQYHPVLAPLLRDGKIPVVPARVWARDDNGTWRARVTLALGHPNDVVPANTRPAGDHVELPPGRSVQVTGEEAFAANLSRYLGRERPALVYATLTPGRTPQAKPKPCVDVLIDGQQVGRLSPQMSAEYLHIVAPIAQSGRTVVARAKVAGNSLQPAVTLNAARVADLSEDWVTDHVRPPGGLDASR